MAVSLMTATVCSILTPAAIARLALGWGAVFTLALTDSSLTPSLPGWLAGTALTLIVGVILICSFGVVHEAEHLARRLGDPYGSLVLTLSIVIIEVVLIAAVMLGPGEHASIARDSVMAVAMIILNAVIGLSVLVGGLKHGGMQPNRTGASNYLAMLVVLLTLALALPAVIGHEGTYSTGQVWPVIVLTLGLYVFFLARQMGAQAGDFREVDSSRTTLPAADPNVSESGAGQSERSGVMQVIAEHRVEVLTRFGLLVATVLPIVLLSHDMAALLDESLDRVGAPVALSGIVIAMIVFLPESITSVRAALDGELQRVSNLCHGALVSTVGLTIPAVLVIGLFTGQPVVLAETPANLLLLGATLLLSITTFTTRRVTALHGAAHLVLFVAYGLTVFS